MTPRNTPCAPAGSPTRRPGSRGFHALILVGLVVSAMTESDCGAASPPSTPPKPVPPPKPWITFDECAFVADPNNDGDSFRVRAGKRTFHVRLYFADCPETNRADLPRVLEQAEYFGIDTNRVLEAGLAAANATRKRLERPFSVRTRWTVAGGRSRLQRYYAFVEAKDGRDLAEWLVENGWARAKGTVATSPSGEPSKSFMERLRRLEATARAAGRGAWPRSRR